MRYKKTFFIIIVLLTIGLLVGGYFAFRNPWKIRGDRAAKIFILSGYDKNSSLSSEYTKGFVNYLNKNKMNFEIKEFYLNFSDEVTEEMRYDKVQEAVREIDEYSPDVVFSINAAAQEVGKYYLDSDLFWVFVGIGLTPFTGREDNVAGVISFLDVRSYGKFLTEVFPGLNELCFAYGDLGGHNEIIFRELEKNGEYFKSINLNFVGLDIMHTFREFKERVLFYQDKCDILVISQMTTFQDENGELVPKEDVVKWLIENNKIPEFTYTPDIVKLGMASAITASVPMLGENVAKIVYGVLVEGKYPKDYGIRPTEDYIRYLNTARLDQLDILVPSSILINSEVYETFLQEDEE